MNYSSECIEKNKDFIKNLLKLRLYEDAEKMSLLNLSINDAQKFIFPSPEQLNINVTYDSLSLMKLPYPVMVFEYTLPALTTEDFKEEKESPETVSSKKMVLAFDCSKDIWPINYLKKIGKLSNLDNGIFVLSFYSVDYHKAWFMDDWGGYFDKNLVNEMDKKDFDISKDFLIHKEKANLPIKIINFLDGHSKHLILTNGPSCDISIKEKQKIILPAVAFSIISTLMLNTKNLKTFKIIDAPEKLNKKRIKNNKTPYFDYHTLDLFFSDNGKLVNRKKLNYGELKQSINSTSILKRLHTVRGHFKVRSTGIFWWNNYARGNKLAGIVEKDYAIKPEKKLKTNF